MDSASKYHENELDKKLVESAKIAEKVVSNLDYHAFSTPPSRTDEEPGLYKIDWSLLEDAAVFPKEGVKVSLSKTQGVKESEGKLTYELDFDFVKGMAECMERNKTGKYAPYNWQKPIESGKLMEAAKRHAMELFIGNYEDDGDPYGHFYALSNNLMMLVHQLKKPQ